jgi:hypothetical protein
MAHIEIKMQSNRLWDTPKKAKAFAEILSAEDDFLRPVKFDYREPERKVFDPNNLDPFIDMWTGVRKFVGLKRTKPHTVWYMVHMLLSEEYGLFNELMSGVDERYFKKEQGAETLLSRVKAIYAWGHMLHGHICHEQDWNQKNYFGVPTKIAGGKTSSTGGLRLEYGIAGIYWANFFGPQYVDFIGAERFESVPAHYKEALSDGGYLIVTSPSPLDYGQREVLKLQEQIIDHLGREFFFEKKRPKKPCRVPAFEYEQQTQESDLIRMEKMMNDLAEAGVTFARDNFGIRLDYSEDSIKMVEGLLEALYASMHASQNGPSSGPSDKQIQSVAMMMGAYIGAVIKKRWPTKWYMKALKGDKLHALKVNGNETFPVNKAYKRLINGQEDNIWDYYIAFKQIVAQ